MPYQDRYEKGSFRGLPFFTESWSAKVGQRRAVYEILFDDGGAASINLGRKPRRYRINAVLLGPDVDVEARDFMAAVEAPDAGLLVHPVLGRVMVITDQDGIEFNASPNEGGKVEISFDAIESRAKPTQLPIAQNTARAALPKATASLRVANKEAFTSNFTLDAVSDFVRDANSATLQTVLTNLRLANGAISAVLSIPGNFAAQIDAVADQLGSLLDTPDRLYDSFEGAIELVYSSLGRVASRFGADVEPTSIDIARPDAVSVSVHSLILASQTSDLTRGSPPPGQRDTPPRIQERINRGAIDQAMQAATLAAIADAASAMELPSKTDNETVRDLLLAALDQLFVQEIEAGVVDALEDLRASIQARFTGGVSVTTFTPRENMPVDVIAWQLYGDAERAQEIVDRNNLADPGEAPGLVPLEVLIS